MGRDDSWPATVWCRLATVLTHPFTTFTSPTGPFLSEWANCRPGNTQNGGTVLSTANLMADSEPGSPISSSRFLVTIRLVSEILAFNRQTDSADHYYSWPPHCGGPANKNLCHGLACSPPYICNVRNCQHGGRVFSGGEI